MLLQIAKFSLVLLVFSLCYIQPFVHIFNLQVAPTEYIFLFTTFIWVLAVLTKQTKFRFHRFYFLLLFYFAAMLISAILSDNQRLSFSKFAGEIYLLSLPVLIFNLVENVAELKRLIKFWLLGTAFAVIVGIFIIFLFYFNREHWLLDFTVYSFGAVPVGNYPRLRLAFVTPSLLCNYLSVSFALLLTAAKLDWLKKSVFFVFAAFILLIAAFTISSGLGGFALIFGLWTFFCYRNKNKFIARASLVVGTTTALLFWAVNFIALQPHSTAPFTFNIFGYELYPSPRVMVWEASWQTFIANPFFGRGVGQDSCEVLFQNTDGNLTTLTDAHNLFLSAASQEGILGLAAILIIIFYFLKADFLDDFSEDKSSVLKTGLWMAFISAFVYQGLVGSFEDSRHLWVLIGLMLCANNLTHRSQQGFAHFTGSAPT